MAARTDTREKILDTAATLLQQRGFNGFSYKDISGPLGIRNAAVHYHFPAKGDLGTSLIERTRELLRERTADFMANGGDARRQVEGYLRYTLDEFDGGYPVCAIGATAAELDNLPPEMRRAGRLLQKELFEWMTRALELGREQGTLPFKGAPDDRAMILMNAVAGARLTGRYSGREALVRTLDAIRRDVGLPLAKH